MQNEIILGLPVRKKNASQTVSTVKNYRTLENIDTNNKGRFRVERLREIHYSGGSHLMTIAPTGAGKGVSAIIPNLLTYDGPVIVVDPKGENYAVTSKYRREVMKQHVIKLDPFGVCGDDTDSFNPFDILPFTPHINDEARMVAELLMGGQAFAKDPFWDNWASVLLTGLVLYLAYLDEGDKPKHKRSIPGIRNLLYESDIRRSLNNILKSQGARMDPEARQNIEAVVGITAVNTFVGVTSTTQQFLAPYGTEAMARVLDSTSFDVKDILTGAPISIYIVIPPSKLVSHRVLFRLWVGALLSLFSSRKARPENNTLFLIDEAAQLGTLQQLATAKTLLRGYGLQTWTFWQDFSQVESLYPNAETIINNCDVLQVFGAKNYRVAKRFADIVGADPTDIRHISDDEQILVIKGDEPVRTTKFNYLRDARFEDKYEPNPLYSVSPDGAMYDIDHVDLVRQRLQEEWEAEQKAARARQELLNELKRKRNADKQDKEESDDEATPKKPSPFGRRTTPRPTSSSSDDASKPKRNPFDLPPLPPKKPKTENADNPFANNPFGKTSSADDDDTKKDDKSDE